jgi:hypothetical protein
MQIHGKTLTLSKAARKARARAEMLEKLQNNCKKMLGRLRGRFELAMPTRRNHLRLVYVGNGTCRNEAAADIAFLQRVIETNLDENDSASEVKAGRIKVTVQVIFPFEQRKAA